MKPIKMMSWNVNGIRAIHKKKALDWFFKDKPEILCLQETKAQPEQVPDQLRQIGSYHSYFCSAEKKGYSGVAIYSKIKPNKVSKGFGINKFDSEGRTLIAEYDNFTLLNIYFPNGKARKERLKYKLDFYDACLKHVEKLKKAGQNIVICGDVNTAHKETDLARPKPNEKTSGFLPIERAWIDKFLEHGYIDTFRMFNDQPDQYTWWDMITRARERNVGWRIDYFYVSESLRERLKSAFIRPEIMGSDHCPIGIELAP
ncbi:MAG: exodeoxyribonuclease III [candidate division Zixibacteria bacterium]|nr:exodeoxyribonuclease III [candidate division Zixibacteria bacterium]